MTVGGGVYRLKPPQLCFLLLSEVVQVVLVWQSGICLQPNGGSVDQQFVAFQSQKSTVSGFPRGCGGVHTGRHESFQSGHTCYFTSSTCETGAEHSHSLIAFMVKLGFSKLTCKGPNLHHWRRAFGAIGDDLNIHFLVEFEGSFLAACGFEACWIGGFQGQHLSANDRRL